MSSDLQGRNAVVSAGALWGLGAVVCNGPAQLATPVPGYGDGLDL